MICGWYLFVESSHDLYMQNTIYLLHFVVEIFSFQLENTKKKLIMTVNIRCEQPFYFAFYWTAPGKTC